MGVSGFQCQFTLYIQFTIDYNDSDIDGNDGNNNDHGCDEGVMTMVVMKMMVMIVCVWCAGTQKIKEVALPLDFLCISPR